jgi:hypothetical protein
VSEQVNPRLVAWGREMREVHDRCAPPTAWRWTRWRQDVRLFPAVEAEHPDVAEPLRKLVRDHAMIGHLVGALRADVIAAADPEALGRHLDGIGAIMESHHRFEERTLFSILGRLGLRAEVTDVFGLL